LFYKFKLKAAEKEQKQKLMKKESIINF